ncbi:MAG TPA: RHS repeat-associated core domain-containing protein, partial [Microthrixaceae bacterium]|nr:RHS repeat-associated core domain-containing protein [Microthrixaceae bacterium]
VETAAGLLPMIEMGARQYLPDLGRFIEVDPVEGGNPNDYSYVIDPIDGSDLDGMCGWTDPWVCVKKVARKAKDIAKSVGRFVKKHRDTIAFGLALILACVGCMAASAGLRVWSTYDACRARQKVSCAVGVASLATFGAAKLRGSAGEALGKAGAARLGASRWHLIRRHVTDPLFASVGGAMKTGGKWLGRASNVGGAYSVCSGYGRCPA